MTHFAQSCSCPPPPPLTSFSLSIPQSSNKSNPILLSSFSFDPHSSSNDINGNDGRLNPQSLAISPTNSNFPLSQPSSASAVNLKHLQPSSLPFSLSTPPLTRSNSGASFQSAETPTSSVFSAQNGPSSPSDRKQLHQAQPQPQPQPESGSEPEAAVDLNQLNTLLYQLASPNNSRSSDPTSASTPTTSRAERRARFESLLSTFHAATVCKLDETNSEELCTSLSELDSHYPVAPNSVLQGIASSMTEPPHQTSTSSSTSSGQPLPSAENPGASILASKIAAPFQDAVREATRARKEAGLPAPKLVGILATPSPPSVAYAEWTKKACQDVGIEFEIWKTWEDSQEADAKEDEKKLDDFDLEADVEDLIIAANADKSVHGIMVYYPIFGGRQDTYLQQIVDPRKDVEGLHFSFCWNMYHNVRWANVRQLGGAPGTTSEVVSSTTSSSAEADQPPPGFAKSILPCTPLAIVKCLESMGVYDRSLPYGDRLYGKTITIFNRSEVVGRPLAALLANDGARVFSVDLDGIQEFNKRAGLGLAGRKSQESTDASTSTSASASNSGRARSEIVKKAHATNSAARLRPHHVVRKSLLQNPQDCVAESQVVISGVPSKDFKIPTQWITPGTFTVNFSSEKNFEKDVRTRAGAHLGAIGKTTIAMLQRNLLRLVEYRELAEESS